MGSPLERAASLVIGTVESVAPGEITVQLDTEAPHETALNPGVPVPFPRLNNYVLVPGQGGAVVGQIVWIGIERSPFPKRKGMQDFGLVDLPFPQRRLKLTPLGTLRLRENLASHQEILEFERGVGLFPSVGDAVSLPTAAQLRAIVEVAPDAAPLELGRSALADSASIRVDPDRMFGRHLAVLGNTGSGKSCTVAGLIRWTVSVTRARRSAIAPGRVAPRRGCRFVVLDPNGEYREALDGTGASLQVLTPGIPKAGERALTVPAWMWNGHEWASFLQAAPGVQQPLLHEAIRCLKTGNVPAVAKLLSLARNLRDFADFFNILRGNLAIAFTSNAKRMESGACLAGLLDAAAALADAGDDPANGVPAPVQGGAVALRAHLDPIVAKVNANFSRAVPTPDEMLEAHRLIEVLLAQLPAAPPTVIPNSDNPVRFKVEDLAATLKQRALLSGDSRMGQYVSTLLGRLDALLSDSRLAPIVNPATSLDLDAWLGLFLGDGSETEDRIVVVDLALVPSDVMHLMIAVIGRLLFEAMQRYHRAKRESLPAVLILEEAHTFIQEGRDDPAQSPTPLQMCRRVFERISREGRKFGLGLVLSSQRPSEVSATVLSQCNTFILHRLVNDEDQNLVRRLVPDTLGSLLRELPVLPARHAILLGHASPVPKLVRVTELPEAHRPKSKDPPILDVWAGSERRDVDWTVLARAWAEGRPAPEA